MLLFLSSHWLDPKVVVFFPLACLLKRNPRRESNHVDFPLSMNLWTKSTASRQSPQPRYELFGFTEASKTMPVFCLCPLTWPVVLVVFLVLESQYHGEDSLASCCPFSTNGAALRSASLSTKLAVLLTLDGVGIMSVYFCSDYTSFSPFSDNPFCSSFTRS